MTDTIELRLRERVKELTALHRTSRILQDHRRPADILMAEIAKFLPDAWQYPEIAAVRIRYRDASFASPGFVETSWMQHVDFSSPTGEGGSITVAYSEERPTADEGPFLTEERELLVSLAEMLSSHLEHQVADEALLGAHDELEAQVQARTADLRRLALRLTLAEERERRRIASDLHDHVGQALAFIRIRVSELQGNTVFGGFEDTFGEVLRLVDQTIDYTRELTGDISPPVLYELGLESALDWLAERFTKKRGFAVRFRVEGQSVALPEDLSVLIFTSARELLSNSQKHAGTKQADMVLRWRAGDLVLAVVDDGRGFDPTKSRAGDHDGHGLFSIRERCNDLGGSLDIDACPGKGCRVTLQLPLDQDSRA